MRNDQSLHLLLDITEDFGECSGLQINYEKSEIFLLGNQTLANVSAVEIRKVKVKKAVKILGVHFTYANALKQKLNFAEIIDSIKGKIKLRRRRNLTITGRIQIVKTVVIPIYNHVSCRFN